MLIPDASPLTGVAAWDYGILYRSDNPGIASLLCDRFLLCSFDLPGVQAGLELQSLLSQGLTHLSRGAQWDMSLAIHNSCRRPPPPPVVALAGLELIETCLPLHPESWVKDLCS